MVERIMKEMLRYFSNDVRRINHALKVYAFAQQLGKEEKLGPKAQEILELAAILHDIGIHEAERKHGSTAGPYQEQEGPPVAAEMLRRCEVDEKTLMRVLFLIGHHHSYADIDGIDFQILIEADFLVNIYEDKLDNASVRSAVSKYFRTESGKALANSLYLSF